MPFIFSFAVDDSQCPVHQHVNILAGDTQACTNKLVKTSSTDSAYFPVFLNLSVTAKYSEHFHSCVCIYIYTALTEHQLKTMNNT